MKSNHPLNADTLRSNQMRYLPSMLSRGPSVEVESTARMEIRYSVGSPHWIPIEMGGSRLEISRGTIFIYPIRSGTWEWSFVANRGKNLAGTVRATTETQAQEKIQVEVSRLTTAFSRRRFARQSSVVKKRLDIAQKLQQALSDAIADTEEDWMSSDPNTSENVSLGSILSSLENAFEVLDTQLPRS